MPRNLRITVSTLAALATLCVANSPLAQAGQTFVTTVRAVHKNEKFEPIGNDDRTGRMVFFSMSRAEDRELKGKGLWVGTTRTATGHWEMVNGHGTGHGFSRTEKAGGSVLVEWTGVCYGVGGTEAKPATYCSGGFFVVPGSGTGLFAGLKGGGTWTGTAGADGNFVEDWNAIYEQ